jgi:hypothetical protein
MMTGCLDGRGETVNSIWGWAAANLGRRDLMKPLWMVSRVIAQYHADGLDTATYFMPFELPAQSQ